MYQLLRTYCASCPYPGAESCARPSKGNGWEVVSSAYAAAHLPLEPEKVKVQNLHESEETFSRLSELDEGTILQPRDFVEKEKCINTDSINTSLFQETNKGGSNTYNDNTFTSGKLESSEELLNPEMLNSLNNAEEGGEYDISKLPCEAWWKTGATFLYTQAKEANAFWSIFVATAVVGLVVMGRRLHRENFEVFQRLSFDSEKMKNSLGPHISFEALAPPSINETSTPRQRKSRSKIDLMMC